MIIKINSLNFMQFSIFFYIGLAFIYNVFGKSLIRLTVENLNYIRGEKRCVSKFGRSENI